MHQLYGTLTWQTNDRDGQATIARMMATPARPPGAESATADLPVHEGRGALAVLAAGELGHAPAHPISWAGLTIVADCRLDNRAGLLARQQLDPKADHDLTDAAILLHGYRRWGDDLPHYLLGDFAFAIWDEARQRLFCVRDIVGVRPFYYHHRPGQGFVWASNLQALLAHPAVPNQLNLPYVKANLLQARGQFHHLAQTFYAAVAKLPPAHALLVDRGGLRTWAYWQPGQRPERRYHREAEYVEEVRALLDAAVACRIQGTVHGVGAHLSGGLDSSSVAVVAHRTLQAADRSATAFSWAPPWSVVPHTKGQRADDERPLVEAVAAFAGGEQPMPLCYTTLCPAHALAHARRDLTVQPTTTLEVEVAAAADAAQLGIRTMLSGWGGDELLVFNGRGYFPDLFRRVHWATLQREFYLQGQIHGGATWKKWLTHGLLPLIPTTLQRWVLRIGDPPASSLPQGLQPDFVAALAKVEPLRRTLPDALVGVRRTQIALLNHGHIPYRLESWAAHGATLGMTYAFPLLDQRIIEFALSIPDYYFFKNGWKRYLYRTAMQGILPDHVRWHKVKEDPAVFKQLDQVYQTARPALRAQLEARKDNPFVAVEALVQAENRLPDLPDSATDERNPRQQRQQMQVGRAALGAQWLAFVDPTATF